MTSKEKQNLAHQAFRAHYDTLHGLLCDSGLIQKLSRKLSSKSVITRDTKDALQLSASLEPAQQATLLLRAVEVSIEHRHRDLRVFVRVLQKETSVATAASQLYQTYGRLLETVTYNVSVCA